MIKNNNKMKQIILIAVMLLSTMLYAQESTYKNVNVQQFENFKTAKEKTLLDVRTPKEFQDGHIKDAKNLNYFDKSFKSELEKLDKNIPVYVYCRSGGRSGKAMQMMKEMGFTTVYNLMGGYLSWSKNAK